MVYNHSRHTEFSIERRHNLQLQEYQKQVEKLIAELEKDGFDKALDYVPSIVDPKKFVLIHATNHLPKNNIIRTSHTVALLGIPNLLNPTRETLHFTVNNMVTAHGHGTWDHCKYAILIPYKHLAGRIHLSPLFDTTICGNVKLPIGTSIIIRQERDLDTLAAPKTIECWGKKIKVDKNVFELGKLAQGYLLYDNHYGGSINSNRIKGVIEDFLRPNYLNTIQTLLDVSCDIDTMDNFYTNLMGDHLTYEKFKQFAECFDGIVTFKHVCKKEDYKGKYRSVDRNKLRRNHGVTCEIIQTSRELIHLALREELLHRSIPLINIKDTYAHFEDDKDNIERFKNALNFRPLNVNPYMKSVYSTAQNILCTKLNQHSMDKIFEVYLNSYNTHHTGQMHFYSWYAKTDSHLLDNLLLQNILRTEYIENYDGHKYWIKHPEEVKAIKRWLRHSRMQHRLKVMLYLIENRESDAALIDILLHCPNRKIAEKKIVSLGLSTNDVNSFLDLYDDVKEKISKIVLDYEKVHGQQVLEKLDKEEKWLAREYAEIHKNHKVYGRGVRKVWRLHNRVMKRFTEDMDPSIRNQYAIAHKKFLEDLETADTNKIEKSINVQLSIIKLLEEWIEEHVLLSNEMKEHHN